jgi:hypothetical protein
MKRNLSILTAAIVTVGFFSALHAAPRSERKMGINLRGGSIPSAYGDFAPGLKTDDVVKTGQSFGLAWQYFPYLFAKDNDKFGDDSNFGDQRNLSVGTGLSYRLASRY